MRPHHLRARLKVCKGKVTYKAVADDLGYDYVPAEEALVTVTNRFSVIELVKEGRVATAPQERREP
jgi:hypothetical protein